MIKFSKDYIARFDEKVICDGCGKQIRRGERIIGYADIVCRDCADKGYCDKSMRNKRRK